MPQDHHGHEHGHGHGLGHGHGHPGLSAASGDRRVALAVAVNMALTAAQVAGGLLAGSVALIADGVHNFADAFALILAFGARRLARRGADAAMSFGWSRGELVAALVNYLTLIVVAGWLAVEAFGRLAEPPEVQGWVVVWLALLALAVDLATAGLTWRLARDSLNIRAAFLHNLTDAGASLAVLAGGAAIVLYDWRLVDPLLTLGISAFILWHVAGDLRPVLRILMLGAPAHVTAREVEARMRAVPGVADVHHLHLWQIDEARASLEAHLVLAEGAGFAAVIRAVKVMLKAEFGLSHVTLEAETAESGCAGSGC